ncbi:hypothetical protein LEMLEM_LOCUS9847, partial [Lemmus lemmus]
FKQDKWIFSLFWKKYLTRTQVIIYAIWGFDGYMLEFWVLHLHTVIPILVSIWLIYGWLAVFSSLFLTLSTYNVATRSICKVAKCQAQLTWE